MFMMFLSAEKSSGYAYETVFGILSEKGMALSTAYAGYIHSDVSSGIRGTKVEMESSEVTVLYFWVKTRGESLKSFYDFWDSLQNSL